MPKDNTTRYILLGLLNHMPMSGYDIKKRIDTSVNRFWSVGYGQIYPTLALLEKEDLIQKTKTESHKGPQRNIYAITNKGRDQLTAWLMLPEEKEYTRYEILLKLFFSSGIPAEINKNRIESFRQRYEQDLALLKMFDEDLKKNLNVSPDHLHYYMTVRFGEIIYDAYLTWAQEALDLIEKKEKESES